MAQKETFPSEIAEQVKEFHLNLISLKKKLEPIIKDLYQIKDEVAKDPIKSATLELTLCQAINSLFYMYLQTTGVDARSHSIGHELYRVENYMKRVDVIKDKALRPKINRNVASAVVRSAMFDLDAKNEQASSTIKSDEILISDDEIEEKPTKRQRTN